MSFNVEALMSTDVVSVTPTDTLATLRKIFAKKGFHHLPVLDGDKLVGIISDRDAQRYTSPFVGTRLERAEDRALLKKTVADIMTRDMVTVDRATSVDTASVLLLENVISCLPVVNAEGGIDGIVTWKDILKFHVYGVDPKSSEQP
ncbi:CBS domain-containing protein [Pseudomaricurvus alkylphenolicus]|jgi:acetoin utilization protein AcuB|uniref:CBS domain-containing protein n=1 Tax=Pseudomaricurvus alkylphenolicus TaxID=1306991 RepID=UPI001420A8A9|nr:CBS domain-containing protein [Pseudomaricurvus alkylphenolicus]NIB41933.1 CBS domain-containing protein [Pseudomaricurvus alkylphenolicus]